MIYIAAPWAQKKNAIAIRNILRLKYEVSSSWMDQPDKPYEEASSVEEASRDAFEVQACDIFLFLNLEMSEGKATELGMAIMMDKLIFCIGGTARNVFLHLPCINHVDSVEGFILAVEAIREGNALSRIR